MYPQPQLLFIPGLGDRAWLCQLVAPLWRVFGYQVHVCCFGWEGDGGLLPQRQERLEHFAQSLPPGPLYVIGLSAGGVAAVNLLAAMPAIRRVVTVASPLQPQFKPTLPLLAAAMDQAQTHFQVAGQDMTGKIISAYGLYDRVVPPDKSCRAGLQMVRLMSFGHVPTICIALTVYAAKLKKLLGR